MGNKYKKAAVPIGVVVSILAFILIVVTGTALAASVFGIPVKAEFAPIKTGGSVSCSSWSSAPTGYQDIFTKAAGAYGISPAFVGAIFLSEHGNNWASEPWASSPKGASGPFQFMPATWDSNQVDGDKDGKKDIQNLTDSAYAAARLLQAQLSTNAGKRYLTVDEKDIKMAGACYNWGCGGDHDTEIKKELDGQPNSTPTETKNYMINVWKNFQDLNKGCTSTIGGFSSNKIVQIAKGEIGTKATGNDCTKYHPGDETKCEPWCADFVSWVYRKAGNEINQPSVSGMKTFFGSQPHKFISNPKISDLEEGDVVFFDNMSHVGIVSLVDKGKIVNVIEGNTGDNKVKLNSYSIADFKGVGKW